MFSSTQCPNETPPPQSTDMCQSCARRGRRRLLRFVPANSNDNEHNPSLHEEEGGNERKNHHEEERRSLLREEGDIIPPSQSASEEVGTGKVIDGPAALLPAGGTIPSF